MQVCPQCKKPDEKEIRYSLGQCERCKKHGAVADIEYLPQVVEDLFGHLGQKPKIND
jgi:ribosomal protein L37AE/L43A